jgi:hypothetical protein
VTPKLTRRRVTPFGEKVEQKEDRYTHVNEKGWGIPAEYAELRRQLVPIQLEYDEEGRHRLMPKGTADEDVKGKAGVSN